MMRWLAPGMVLTLVLSLAACADDRPAPTPVATRSLAPAPGAVRAPTSTLPDSSVPLRFGGGNSYSFMQDSGRASRGRAAGATYQRLPPATP